MIFANVSNITIPEGSVERITETKTGRVLWKRGLPELKAHWEVIEFANDTTAYNYYNYIEYGVDVGDGIELFNFADNKVRSHFNYKPSGALSNVYALWRGAKLSNYDFEQFEQKVDSNVSHVLRGVAVDPISKIWILSNGTTYASNAFNPVKYKTGTDVDMRTFYVCWSPELERFCLVGGSSEVGQSYLLDINGNIRNSNTNITSTNFYVVNTLSYFHITWSNKLRIFVVSDYNGLHISRDGLNWEDRAINSVSNAPSGVTLPSGPTFRAMAWIPTLDVFVIATFSSKKWYIYKSYDCYNWEYVTTLSTASSNTSEMYIDFCWSPDAQILLLSGSKTSYITRDLSEWVEIPNSSGPSSSGNRCLFWSKSFNSFIRVARLNSTKIHKLVLD